MATTDWQDPNVIDTMLDEAETWAVVGLSGDPSRTAYRIAALLQRRGKRIVPIHPAAPTVLGEQGYPTARLGSAKGFRVLETRREQEER